MRALCVFLFVFVATAADDATALLNDVAKQAREFRTWQAEGKQTYESGKSQTEISFRVAMERSNDDSTPNKARLEYRGGRAALIRVCDGQFQWTELIDRREYWKVPARRSQACAYPFTEWSTLGSELHSPVIVGHESLKLPGRMIDCTIVQGELTRSAKVVDTRTLWIDETTKLVWMYRVEHTSISGAPSLSIRTFALISQLSDEPVRSPDSFEFRPPHGGKDLAAPLLDFDGPEDGRTGMLRPVDPPGVYKIGANVIPPSAILRVEPTYPKGAAKIEGTVVLLIVVQADGIPGNIRVLRSINPGFDQKAIEAVSKWRFRPAIREGIPVPVQATIEVNFKLR